MGIALEVENGIKSVGTWKEGEFEKWTLIKDLEIDLNDTEEDVSIPSIRNMIPNNMGYRGVPK